MRSVSGVPGQPADLMERKARLGAALAAQARFSAVCLAAVQWKPTVLPPVD